jgi:hypothetical protein
MDGRSLGGYQDATLSPEEMRRKRLEAFAEDSANLSTAKRTTFAVEEDEDAELQAALALSLQEMEDPPETLNFPELIQESYNTGEPYAISSFHSIWWDASVTTQADQSRWVSQGINVRQAEDSAVKQDNANDNMLEELASSHLSWGLLQQFGGPCGILAAIQAEMLRLLVFGRRIKNTIDYPLVGADVAPAEHLSTDLLHSALARAVGLLLARAALTPCVIPDKNVSESRFSVRIVLPTQRSDSPLVWSDLAPWDTSPPVKSSKLTVYTISLPENGGPKRLKTDDMLEERMHRLARIVADFLLTPHGLAAPPLDHFRRDGGVMLFAMSLVASRTPSVIQDEFDDTNSRLTSQFGHTSQELINLLLTGQAVSNVFDNTLKPSDMECRGVQNRPCIGYLTQLESLRLCEVGSFYKSPKFPIWVVGSTSHFTVLYGSSSALKESESDMLLERCRRAFKGVEGGEENGFIASDKLGAALQSLELRHEDSAVQLLAASMEVSGAGIILWDDFWKMTSRLMTGASIETVLAGRDDPDDLPPLLLVDGTETVTHKQETDEEMARRLTAEYDESPGMTALATAAVASSRISSPSPMQVETPMTDEELAKLLQAEWDAEAAGLGGGGGIESTGSDAAVTDSPERTFADFDVAAPPTPPRSYRSSQDAKPAAKDKRQLEFEKYGDSFPLYHYNGLRGGLLTPLRVTRLSAEEAVGASIALNRGGVNGANDNHKSGGDNLEDLLRTKWPSCMINWLGQSPPYIN